MCFRLNSKLTGSQSEGGHTTLTMSNKKSRYKTIWEGLENRKCSLNT